MEVLPVSFRKKNGDGFQKNGGSESTCALTVDNGCVLGVLEGQEACMLANGVPEKYVQHKKLKKQFGFKALESIRSFLMTRSEIPLTL